MSNSFVLVLILAFFYCNATAFAALVVVIVLILVLDIRHDKKGKDSRWVVVPLRLVMVLDLLSLMGAYGAGTCRDKISTVYSTVPVAIVFLYILVFKTMDCWDKNSGTGTGSSSVDCLRASTATSSLTVSLAVPPTGSLIHDSMLVMSDTAPRPLSAAVAIVRRTLHFFPPPFASS